MPWAVTRSATRLSGINVDRVKSPQSYACAAPSALARPHCHSPASAQPTAGMGYELDAIAAVVLGAPA